MVPAECGDETRIRVRVPCVCCAALGRAAATVVCTLAVARAQREKFIESHTSHMCALYIQLLYTESESEAEQLDSILQILLRSRREWRDASPNRNPPVSVYPIRDPRSPSRHVAVSFIPPIQLYAWAMLGLSVYGAIIAIRAAVLEGRLAAKLTHQQRVLREEALANKFALGRRELHRRERVGRTAGLIRPPAVARSLRHVD